MGGRAEMDLVDFSNKNLSVLLSLDFGILPPKQNQTEHFALNMIFF